MKKAYICFTRIPVPGQTKTRLMPLLGGEGCAALHTCFLRDIAAVSRQCGADLYIAYVPVGDPQLLRGIFPDAKGFFPQEGADLGEKMHNALCRVLALGYDAVLLTGSDLPCMTAHHLQSGFDALNEADVAIGPTPDGGYYLIGTKSPCPALFSGQTYSHASVFENTCAAARAAGFTVCPVMPCTDVDTPEDLRVLWQQLDDPTTHTAVFLKRLYEEGVLS